jgi:hypothetical protein
MPTPRAVAILLITSVLLSGCATNAQRREGEIRAGLITAVNSAKQCIASVNDNPKFYPLWRHAPKPPASPTIEQLADPSLLTADDIVLESAHHDAILPCRDALATQLGNIDGRLQTPFADFYNETDEIILALVQNKISWGEGNRQITALQTKFQAKLHEAASQMDAELAQQNAAELERRAEIAQAITTGLAAAAQAAEEARPVTTTCRTGFNYASCTTR